MRGPAPATAASTDREAWGIVAGDSMPLDPDRWAEERQYLRNDGAEALSAFRRCVKSC